MIGGGQDWAGRRRGATLTPTPTPPSKGRGIYLAVFTPGFANAYPGLISGHPCRDFDWNRLRQLKNGRLSGDASPAKNAGFVMGGPQSG